MQRTLGLAPIACCACGAEQLAPVHDLVANASIPCMRCGTQESAASVLGRHKQLAQMVTLLRELDGLKGQRTRGGTAASRREAAHAAGAAIAPEAALAGEPALAAEAGKIAG
jgi:hypothetical protein